MKILIIGGAGFYGKHLKEELFDNKYDVVCADINAGEGIIPLNILESERILEVIEEVRPDAIVNMAGQANVGLSWKKPQLTVQLNTVGMINLLEAVKEYNRDTRIIAIGSSDEYGILKNRGVDVTEDVPVCPATPYAISKLAQEQFSQLYVKNYKMNVCMVRQFNLGGAGQAKGFMISDFASGIAEVEAGIKDFITVGNLDSSRDYTHVKDASMAIRLLLESGHPGEIYNVCSGKTYSAQYILDRMISMSTVLVKVVQDEKRMRPSDTPVICGNHDKLTAHTAWKPERDVDEIIKDALEYWRGMTKNVVD